jgi:hypothetical protein
MKKSRTCCYILLALPPVLGTPGSGGRSYTGIDDHRRTGRKQRGDHCERIGHVEFVTHPPNQLTGTLVASRPWAGPATGRQYPDQPKFCPALWMLYGDRRCADGPKYSQQRNDPSTGFRGSGHGPYEAE